MRNSFIAPNVRVALIYFNLISFRKSIQGSVPSSIRLLIHFISPAPGIKWKICNYNAFYCYRYSILPFLFLMLSSPQCRLLFFFFIPLLLHNSWPEIANLCHFCPYESENAWFVRMMHTRLVVLICAKLLYGMIHSADQWINHLFSHAIAQNVSCTCCAVTEAFFVLNNYVLSLPEHLQLAEYVLTVL